MNVPIVETILFTKPSVERPHPIAGEGGTGVQKIWRFANGYGASVVQFDWKGMGRSYGVREGKWELAVIRFDGEDWDLTYDTEITSDVVGHLSPEEVEEYLARIKKLVDSKK